MMTKQKTRKMLLVCSILSLSCVLLFFSNCGSNDPNPQELRLNELSATWEVTRVTNDGTDVTNQYTGFTLTASVDKTYNTTNGGNPWPAAGTFDFLNDTDVDRLRRSDGTTIIITEVTTTNLTLSLQVNSVRGTAAGITGDFTFSLLKQ